MSPIILIIRWNFFTNDGRLVEENKKVQLLASHCWKGVSENEGQAYSHQVSAALSSLGVRRTQHHPSVAPLPPR
jgi:hypothetical protein